MNPDYEDELRDGTSLAAYLAGFCEGLDKPGGMSEPEETGALEALTQVLSQLDQSLKSSSPEAIAMCPPRRNVMPQPQRRVVRLGEVRA